MFCTNCFAFLVPIKKLFQVVCFPSIVIRAYPKSLIPSGGDLKTFISEISLEAKPFIAILNESSYFYASSLSICSRATGYLGVGVGVGVAVTGRLIIFFAGDY